MSSQLEKCPTDLGSLEHISTPSIIKGDTSPVKKKRGMT